MTAMPSSFAAINQNSKNKRAAFEFVKFLLSEEVQSSPIDTSSLFEIPVHTRAYDMGLEYYMGEKGSGHLWIENGIDIKTLSLPESLVSQAKGIIGRMNKCELIDENIMDFIYEGFDEYVEGKCTAEQAAQMIQQKVTLYFYE